MQYLIQRYQEEQKEQVFRIYVTDALRVISENTARSAGGSKISVRYWDMIDDRPHEPQRTSEDIIESISNTLDLIGREERQENECI